MSSPASLQSPAPSPYHVSKGQPHNISTMTTRIPSSEKMSTSCPEFRNGYRIQRRAYERRAQTPTLATIIRNRQAKNEYVDVLKQFYNMDAKIPKDHYCSTSPHRRIPSGNTFLPGEPLSSRQNTNTSAKIKSILKLPDVKFSSAGKVNNGNNNSNNIIINNNNNTVKITLPSERSATNRRNSASAHNSHSHSSMFRHVTKIPPPVPFQLCLSAHSQLEQRLESLSPSSSSNLTASILEAVNNNSGKTSTMGRSPKALQLQNRKRQRPLTNYEPDPKRLSMKVSMPCRIGCCYCVYSSSILGPVKVYLTKGKRPKQGPWVTGIRDGYGRLSIPVSRKSDVTGLVYDPRNYSLHPPTRGQRPMYPSTKSRYVDKKEVKDRKGVRAGNSRSKKKT